MDNYMAEAALDVSGLLANALNSPSVGERGRVVREIAALFMRQASQYSAVQVDLFDKVLMKLVDKIEEEVRVFLAKELSSVDNAPYRLLKRLASEDEIAAASPVLINSPCLDEDFLLACAKSKSQQHLVAISSRKAISYRLTDVLVERGDDQVVLTLARNEGAEFSDRGCSIIVERARDNYQLTRVLWKRHDIPRPQVVELFRKASQALRQELLAQDSTKAQDIAAAIGLASQELQEKSQESSYAYVQAKLRIDSLQRSGGLSESHVISFARQGMFEAVVAAVSEMSGLSDGEAERTVLDTTNDRLFIVARAIGLSWISVRQILLMKDCKGGATEQLWERLRAKFQSIPREAAAKTLQFLQLREKAQACR
jgi:uncharacterized protein (DUF2336 family)